ncbi:transcription elongation factor GreB [Parendozoicomonas haliclonae]|uniref:Transcription elongation factor GreB n=1 Tax=Parendozoicomonas haliclonae TaxID=1960125 RepID=A0A1X7ATD9_9GAMM|nr:transcription elongation factor GreB [Parendozoicomonas haliclonae]SMA50677.1 Transcription elongation factor GreB [Parendozoicomonas haliclonae]
MSRYRAPLPPSSRYITPEGYKKLEQEHDDLWRVQRPAVTQAVSEAAALGDRSENAEYIYGKKQLREIDRRVRYLRKRLEQLKIVSEVPDNPRKIYFGAWVTLEDDDGQEKHLRLVGPDELDLSKGWISIDAPLSRILLGKEQDTEFEFTVEGQTTNYYIVAVSYTAP